jgi:hypothetical protein
MKLFRAMPVTIYRHVPVLGVGSGQWIVACGSIEITAARPDNTEVLIEHEALGPHQAHYRTTVLVSCLGIRVVSMQISFGSPATSVSRGP